MGDPYRAVLCERLDGPDALRFTELPRRALAPGEVRVAIQAAGLNFPDLLMTRGLYQLRPKLPFTPGMEAAGIVIESMADIAIGARVTLGLRFGGYAEEAICPASSLGSWPEGFTAAEAACFAVAAGTADHALVDRGRLLPDETLLVLGAGGGVGLAAVEIGAALGARVIAAASTAEKRAAVLAKGAMAAIDSDPAALRDAVMELTEDRGADLVYDPVGDRWGEAAIRALAWGGRYLVVGFAGGQAPHLASNHALIKGHSILGIRAGEARRRDPSLREPSRARIAQWCAEGRLRPHISHSGPLDAAAALLSAMERREIIGRAALLVD
jgi:NADPH:quinone reductase